MYCTRCLVTKGLPGEGYPRLRGVRGGVAGIRRTHTRVRARRKEGLHANINTYIYAHSFY